MERLDELWRAFGDHKMSLSLRSGLAETSSVERNAIQLELLLGFGAGTPNVVKLPRNIVGVHSLRGSPK